MILNCPTLVGNVKEDVSAWKWEGDLERFFLKTNKSAVENAMNLAENDDENVVEMPKTTVENAVKMAKITVENAEK